MSYYKGNKFDNVVIVIIVIFDFIGKCGDICGLLWGKIWDL